MKLLVAITFFYNPNKLWCLKKSLDALAKLNLDSLTVVVTTNDITEQQQNYIRNLNPEIAIMVDSVKHIYDPRFLAWAHKQYMISFYLGNYYDHFLYMEDDLEMTQDALDYWVNTTELIKRNNLNFIPAFHRVEYDKSSGIAYSLDQKYHRNSLLDYTIERKQFVFLSSPYQAMFLMNREDVYEHMFSPSFRFETATPFEGVWLVQDLAAQGNCYSDVPKDLPHRMITPVDGFEKTWIHHMTDNYIDNPNTLHGKIPALDLIK